MFISTLEAPPPGFRIVESGGMVWSRKPIMISQKGLLKTFMERGRDEDREAFEAFSAQGRATRLSDGRQANAILGTRMTTTTAVFAEGTMLLVTYSGTAVYLEED